MARYEELSVGSLLTTGDSQTNRGVGALEGTAAIQQTITVVERGNDILHKTIINFLDTPLTLLDTGTGLGHKIYTFPVGRISQKGGTSLLGITTTSTLTSTLNAGVVVQVGVGSVTQTGALSTTEQDFINEYDLVSSAVIDVAGAQVGGVGIPVLAVLDGTSTAIAAFLNFNVTTGTEIDADATILVNGYVTMHWVNLGTD